MNLNNNNNKSGQNKINYINDQISGALVRQQTKQSHPGALKILLKNKNDLLQSLLLIAFRLQP